LRATGFDIVSGVLPEPVTQTCELDLLAQAA
jgi:hypothetical protein